MNTTTTHRLTIGSDTYIATDTARTRIRGGGAAGGSAWIAKITGTHPQYKLDRTFCDKNPSTSRSGRSGHIDFALDGPGVYEYRGFAETSSHTRSGFVRITPDAVVEISRDEAIAAAEAGDL